MAVFLLLEYPSKHRDRSLLIDKEWARRDRDKLRSTSKMKDKPLLVRKRDIIELRREEIEIEIEDE